MAYDRYPAVDANYRFPPEVQRNNNITPLTEAERNALTGVNLWDGRTILNTTTDRINRWDAGAGSWKLIPEMIDVEAFLNQRTLIVTTGTVRIQLGTDYSDSGEGTSALRGTSGLVQLDVYVKALTARAAGATVLTMPSLFRPHRILRPTMTQTDGSRIRLTMLTDGRLYAETAVGLNVLIYGHLTYYGG